MTAQEKEEETSPAIHHRFVDFGTNFVFRSGKRLAEHEHPPHELCSNEIVVDVGAACHGPAEPQWIFDHHFPEAAHPCAAVAVLAHAEAIRGALAGKAQDLWIVTHREPDFDALCASYLVRCLADGSLDFGAQDDLELPARWDHWFDPIVDPECPHRWAILLAAYAARLDQAKGFLVSRERGLHSLLYAAFKRKRSWYHDGLRSFFDATRIAMDGEKKLNPIYDSLFDAESAFAPELELLAQEPERYRRDVRRSRKSIIRVPVARNYPDYYAKVSSMPLLHRHPDDEFQELLVTGDHLEAMAVGDSLCTFDAIWIEDPESLLFKEWAREDLVNSSLNRGFTFTAVRYRDATLEWFFSLDPERAGGAHLYPLWAKLQRQETEARRRLDRSFPENTPIRTTYEERAAGAEEWFGNDPWFDGGNYRGTIVVSPNGRTVVNETSLPELNRLPGPTTLRLPMDLAQSLLEDSVFAPFDSLLAGDSVPAPPAQEARLRVWQFPVDEAYRSDHPNLAPCYYDHLVEALDIEPARNHYLFAEVRLDLPEHAQATTPIGIGLNNRDFAEQIGRKIWPLLERRGVNTVPADFSQRHVLINPHRVAVWSRRGVVIAATQGDEVAQREVTELREQMEEIWKISHDLNELRESVGHLHHRISDRDKELVHKLIRRLARLNFVTSLPEGLSLRRFVEASRFDRVIEPLNHLIESVYEAEERAGEQKVNRILGGLAIAVAVFGLPSFLDALFDLQKEGWDWKWITLAIVSLVAAGGYLVYRLTRSGPARSSRSDKDRRRPAADPRAGSEPD